MIRTLPQAWAWLWLSVALVACGAPGASSPLQADPGESLQTLVGEPLLLDASASEGAAIFHWNFGDGESESSPDAQVEHRWLEPGHYTAVLEIEAADGRRDSAPLRVDVTWPAVSSLPERAARMSSTADGGRLFVALPDFDRVAVLDRESREVVSHLSTCEGPSALSHSAAAGLLVVSCPGAGVVEVWDSQKLTAVHSLDALGHGAGPVGAVFSEDGEELYVLTAGQGALRAFSVGESLVPVWTQEGLIDPGGIARLGTHAFVTRRRSPDEGGQWWHIELTEGGALSLQELAPDPGPDSDTSHRGVPNLLVRPAVSPDGRRVVFPSLLANNQRGGFLDGEPLTHETTARAVLSQASLIDGVPGEEGERKIFDDRDLASDAVFSPLGDWVYVTQLGVGAVDVLDAYSLEGVGSYQALGQGLDGVWVAPTGRELWVLSSLTRELVVIDIEGAGGDVERIDLRPGGVEVLEEAVLLGKQVFHAAGDPRMSRDGYLSCASCHLDGTQDGRTWDFTDRGEGLRNTITLAGSGGTGHGPIHWSGNFDEIQDFEADIRGGMGGQGFLSEEDWLEASEPLGQPKAGRSVELDALAAYLATLTEVPASPYREADGSLTGEAVAGQAIFEDPAVGCADCHPAPEYTDSSWLADGEPLLHDVGTIGAASGDRLGEGLVGLDTPSLRGVWASPPYLHDGSASTLREVLVDRGHPSGDSEPPALTAEQLDQLEAFLLQIE